MLACRTLGKGLRLRAVLLDVAVLERSPHEPKLRRQESAWGLDSPRCPEQLIAQRKVKLLLLSEIRAELFKRGAPIIGKRWELEARLEKLYAAEPDSMLTPAGERETAGETAASLREKYAAKLRAKTGGSIGPSAGSRQPAQDMRVASEIAAASAGWRLRAGARELMQYFEVRGMRRALLSDASAAESATEQARELTAKLQVQSWDWVVPVSAAASLRESGDIAALQAACEALDVPLGSMLVLSASPRAISAARAAQAPSCYFWRNVPDAPKRIPADAVASSMNEVRHCVEDFNGVTFRDANTHISTRYGGC